jgi:4-alpha-glucanotransferase
MLPRCSGILLPIFSLPSRYGIGDFGPAAARFVDWMHAAGQRVWQILPLNPTGPVYHHSPYHSASAFALSPLLVSPERLAEEGLFDLVDPPALRANAVDYEAVTRLKQQCLREASQRFMQRLPNDGYTIFCRDNAAWLEDYALFTALKAKHPQGAWDGWPIEFQQRRPEALQRVVREAAEELEHLRIEQYLLQRQLADLKRLCRTKGVQLFGDMPIYVPFDSVDVWAYPFLFRLDAANRPEAVSGVPPDYFSAEGQRWGHPVYNWPAHTDTRYDWWVRRFARNLELFDYLRIDHFRGLVAYWEIPADAPNAMTGRWVETPVHDFFRELQLRLAALPLVAEDLGIITADVRETMRRNGLPGMRVLLFGFAGDPALNDNSFHNIPAQSVVFTGTHDNNTVRGWFEAEATAEEKRRLTLTIGPAANGELHWEMVRLAMMSPARICITPVQDLLGLGGESRINNPGGWEGNWMWRMSADQFEALPGSRLREMAETFARV